MHKISRSLLLAGVLAFGTLSAACGDTVNTTLPSVTGVSAVSVTPATATIQVGETIQLSTSVTADATTAKTVTYTSSNTAVATVDAAGKVTGVKAGTVSVNAVSTADASKSAAAAITVTNGPVTQPATISINSVNDAAGAPVNLANVNGQVNVTVNTTGGGSIEVFLSPSANCASNTIVASDVSVASQAATSTSNGTVTLSFNTAQVTAANAAKFANGSYCVKARLTPTTGAAVIATNTVPFTLNNANTYGASLAFASQTGGATSAVSSLNGLNYNQGTLTITIKPVIYSSSSPVALISGTVSRAGEQAGVNPAAAGAVVFSNVAVKDGIATIVLADTAGAAAATSIYQYTSPSTGDAITITAATDAAGNALTTTAVTAATGIRIDNDIPNTVGAVFAVTPPVGRYINGAYKFADGTTGTASADNRGGVSGVGGVTVTYYVGAAGSAAFATANSCTVTGLTASTTGVDLASTTTNTAYAAKVVVQDALGNKTCSDLAGTFGVDKIAPSISIDTTAAMAKDGAAFRVTKNWTFIYSDTISGFNPALPLRGTLIRNAASSTLATDCLFGVYNATTKVCGDTTLAGAFEFTKFQNTAGYYTVKATAVDQAGNRSGTITATAAFDDIAPTAPTALTQSPATATALGTVTVAGSAADNFNLISARANLTYGTVFFQAASRSLGSFGTRNTSGAFTITLPTPVYLGLQSTTGNVIQATGAAPVVSVKSQDLTDSSTAATLNIATQNGKADFLVGTVWALNSSINGTQAATRATTNLTVTINGTTAGMPNQPFAAIDLYKVVRGELVFVGTQTLASVTDNGSGGRIYTYTFNGVALTAGTAGATSVNDFYAIGRDAAANAVISNVVSITNPAQ
jgi:hypothetical protein